MTRYKQRYYFKRVSQYAKESQEQHSICQGITWTTTFSLAWCNCSSRQSFFFCKAHLSVSNFWPILAANSKSRSFCKKKIIQIRQCLAWIAKLQPSFPSYIEAMLWSQVRRYLGAASRVTNNCYLAITERYFSATKFACLKLFGTKHNILEKPAWALESPSTAVIT